MKKFKRTLMVLASCLVFGLVFSSCQNNPGGAYGSGYSHGPVNYGSPYGSSGRGYG